MDTIEALYILKHSPDKIAEKLRVLFMVLMLEEK